MVYLKKSGLSWSPKRHNTKLEKMKRKKGTHSDGSKGKRKVVCLETGTNVNGAKCLYVRIEAFPHLQYVLSLVKECSSRILQQISNISSEFINQENQTIKLVIDGERYSEIPSFVDVTKVTSSKGDGTCSPGTNWPSKPLIFYQSDSQSASEILKVAQKKNDNNDVTDIIMVTQSNECSAKRRRVLKPVKGWNVFMVQNTKKDINNALTEVLEMPIFAFLTQAKEKLMKKMNQTRRLKENEILLDEIDALLSLVKRSPETTNSNLVSCPVIPQAIKDYLYRKREVTAFGIYNRTKLQVFLKSRDNTLYIERHLRSIGKEFFKGVQLDFIYGKMLFANQIAQGDKLYNESGVGRKKECSSSAAKEKEIYGTLGGFVVQKSNTEDIFALTCSHVYPVVGQPAYAKLEDCNQSRIGECWFSNPTGETFCDFAVVQIDESVRNHCDLVLTNKLNRKCKSMLFNNRDLSEIKFVHKKGATTQLTDGIITHSEYYDKLFEGRNDVFLVAGLGEKKFSEGGDSGSVVFAHDGSTSQRKINVIGMVSHGQINSYDNICASKPDLSVCFRMSDAFEIVENVKPGCHLEFENFSDSSSNESSD